MNIETTKTTKLSQFNGLISLTMYSIYPFLLIQWKDTFGIGWSLSVLILFSLTTRIFGALVFSKAAHFLKLKLNFWVLIAASLGAFGYSFVGSYLGQILGILLIGVAHGVWLANLQNVLNSSAHRAENAAKLTSEVQLRSNIGIVLGSLISNPMNIHLGFQVSAIMVAITFLLLAIAIGSSDGENAPVTYPPIVRNLDQNPTVFRGNISLKAGMFVVAAILVLIAYSAINYLVPLFGKELQKDFPIGYLFALNSALVLVFQPVFSKFKSLHKWAFSISAAYIFILLGFGTLFLGQISATKIYIFVSFVSLAEVLMFPSLSGLFKDLIDRKILSMQTSSSVFTTTKIFGLGAGGLLWPKLSTMGSHSAAVLGIALTILSATLMSLDARKESKLRSQAKSAKW